ncbi:MAG: hypothetical protein QOK36_1945, partial [Gaiellales bacterium]|nr:hypothetical protein [Gaiellales bacterium]
MKIQRPRLRTAAAICALGAIVAAAATFILLNRSAAEATSSVARPSPAAIAGIQVRYGVRFTMRGLTASGGMLEPRVVAVAG